RQRPAPVPKSTTIALDGVVVDVAVKVSKRARGFRLSLPASGPLLTLPEKARWADAEAFLHKHRNWLAARLPRSAQAQRLVAGMTVRRRGGDHVTVATGKVRGRVDVVETSDGPELHVPGAHEHLPRRLYDWLKGEALADLTVQSEVHAARLGVSVKQVR